MTTTVFGSTGGTGRRVVREALRRGERVIAFARRPEALGVHHPLLTVVQGDVLDPATIDAAVEGSDAVVSALGIGQSRAATTVYSAGTANIIDAMSRAGVARLVCVTTSGLGESPEDTLAQRLVGRMLQRMLARPYADMAAMEALVRDSGVDWTIVRPARLTDGAGTGRVRLGIDQRLRAGWSVPRDDLAACLLDCVESPRLVGKTVEVARPPRRERRPANGEVRVAVSHSRP